MAIDDLAPFEAKIGTVLKSKWTLERLLGVGGMAAVYAARHRVGTTAAIKILHPEIARSTELRLRFEREAMAMGKLDHPGAVRVLDIDVTKEGAPFLVMELLEGESLKERMIREGHLPMPELLRVADETLDVIAAAHAEGIVHRDIKPDNMFLTKEGPVKVLDFGIARMHQASTMTMTGERLGTLPYMPPEQVRGEDVDARVDIFALGAVMFRIVAGRRVHDAKTESAMLVAMSSKPAPPLATVCATAPEGICRVVDRALAFSRDDRYPDARCMQGDVRALRRGEAPPFAAGAPASAPLSDTAAATPFHGPASGPGRAVVAGDAGPMSATAAPTGAVPTSATAPTAVGPAMGPQSATATSAGAIPSTRQGPSAASSEPTKVSSGAASASVTEPTKISAGGVAAAVPEAAPPRRGPGYTVLTDDASPGGGPETPVVGAVAGQAYAAPVGGAVGAPVGVGPTVPGGPVSVAARERDPKPLILLGAAGLLAVFLIFAGLAFALSGGDEETSPTAGDETALEPLADDDVSDEIASGGAFPGVEGAEPPERERPSVPTTTVSPRPTVKADKPPPEVEPPPASPPAQPTSIKLPSLVPPKDDGPPPGKGPPEHAKGHKKKKKKKR